MLRALVFCRVGNGFNRPWILPTTGFVLAFVAIVLAVDPRSIRWTSWQFSRCMVIYCIWCDVLDECRL